MKEWDSEWARRRLPAAASTSALKADISVARSPACRTPRTTRNIYCDRQRTEAAVTRHGRREENARRGLGWRKGGAFLRRCRRRLERERSGALLISANCSDCAEKVGEGTVSQLPSKNEFSCFYGHSNNVDEVFDVGTATKTARK